MKTQENLFKRSTQWLALGVVSSLLIGCANTPNTQQQLSQQTQAGVLWMQQSGEYQALAHQAFNIAKLIFDNTVLPSNQIKTVIVDLDETMIDNSPYAAWQILENQRFSPDTWKQWVNAKQATAIPGAVEFAHHVVNNGGKLFYVSNRKQDGEYQATLDNLIALGFPEVNSQTLRLKTDTSNKDTRFEQIREAGYQVIMHIGDNLGDFAGEPTYHKDNQTRRDFVEMHKDKFGIQYIVLPNPSYGDWEAGLAKDYYKLDADKLYQLRQERLNKWRNQ